ncbi:hypothetical protein STRDD11_00597 [Streptococcus sp. DD11]|uniref:hypothetical protein n=1 Tax=Streptococcus sp. DD11 TaxID=1777879 RepID=UPI00079693C1|nr:hypothetical protein [Streptococcus sp. DD11]KXT84995.1 hypothetical protein STRDD11_00597 [Streptococcus sp. DD11]
MNEVKVFRILKRAWVSMTDYYFVWLGGLLLIGIPLVLLGAVLFFHISNWSYQSILILTCLAFLIAFGLAYINKFSLTMVRSPYLVKLYLGPGIWYSISDGFFTRLLYSFIVSAVQVLLLYMGWTTIGVSLGVASLFTFYRLAISPESVVIFQFLFPFLFMVFYLLFTFLVDSHFFLLPYIIQDTSSADNLSRPLSFMGCLKKSVTLMDGYRGRYVLLSFSLMLAAMLGCYLYHFLLMVAVPFLTASFGGYQSLIYGILLLPALILASGFYTFSLSARTIFANSLMEKDWDVADFGE